MLSQKVNLVVQPSCPRSAVQDEAARLKAEIAQRGDELARLERLAGSVSHSRQGARLHEWPQNTIPPTIMTTGASTGRIIEQLQREIDQLKLASQAAIKNYESERRARETLQLKCDSLESSITSLRTQTQSHAFSLQRTDKALSSAKDNSKSLQTTLLAVAEEKEKMDQQMLEKDTLIADLRAQLEAKSVLHQFTENQYNVLNQEYGRVVESYRAELSTLQGDIRAIESSQREDLLQTRTAKEDIILFNATHADSFRRLKESSDALAVQRTEQVKSMQASTNHLHKLIEQLLCTTAHDTDEIGRLKVQLETIKDSLRVIKLASGP